VTSLGALLLLQQSHSISIHGSRLRHVHQRRADVGRLGKSQEVLCAFAHPPICPPRPRRCLHHSVGTEGTSERGGKTALEANHPIVVDTKAAMNN